jgi:trk system potassium uptake protein TrkH
MKEWDPKVSPYISRSKTPNSSSTFTPPKILFLGFLSLIALGTLLLWLPVSVTEHTSFSEALFTATSAVTVTGLVVVDTGTHFTTFGQVVIAFLIQAGGLGFMTFAVIIAQSLGAKLGLKQQLIAKEAFGQTSLEKVVQTAKLVAVYAIVIELIGFLGLWAVWSFDMPLQKAAYEAFFYTISAFNNAGFALASDSLSGYADSLAVNLIISALFIIGGIGFIVIIDLHQNKSWSKLSVNTRLILKATLMLNISAFILIWVLEASNPHTLGTLSIIDQGIAAWFQAVTPRTAGFNTLPVDQLTDATTTLTILLMFIGGGSMSTASGIKLGTFIILVMATMAFLTNKKNVTLMQRTVTQEQIMKALSLSMISMGMIFISIFLLTVTESAPFLDIVFEAVSAISTVGLSRGLTSTLSAPGEIVVIIMMLVGRVGPLTFAYMLAMPEAQRIKYPEAKVQIG